MARCPVPSSNKTNTRARKKHVQVNSSWTRDHIARLWRPPKVHLVFPPCDTAHLQPEPQQQHRRNILSVGQFRPEKDHPLQLRALRLLLDQHPQHRGAHQLLVVGGCRTERDKRLLHDLRELAQSLDLREGTDIQFLPNVPYPEVSTLFFLSPEVGDGETRHHPAQLLDLLRTSAVGLHTMWNEHFGICVVEYMVWTLSLSLS